ncbi:MAG TPA: PH domain-containing protein [Rubrobacteraceae bacterium]|nr:PH domain-containing protein [Rubrobacteraceae bacterium]
MSSEPRHLHPAAMIIAAIRTIRRSLSAFVIPGIAFLMSRGLDPGTIALVLLGALVVAVLAAFWGFLSWRATTYEVAGGAFRLRQGVVQKNERTIPLDHVQSVDTVQGLIQRLFDVVEVRIETAGGGASEPDASLAALGRPEAQALRREIEGSRREPVEAEEAPEPAIIRKLGTRELLVAGATSGQIGVALSLLAVASQLFDEVLSEDIARRLLETFAPRSVTTALLYVFILGLFAWLLAIGGTVLAHAGFTLSRDGEFLYIRRGLLERREATIPLARIQAIRVSEGLLRQPFGLASLRVESAGYGEDAGVSTVLYPLLPRREVREFLQAAAPEFAVDPPLDALPRRALRRYVFRSTVPVLVLLVAAGLFSLLVFEFALWSLAAMLLLLPAALYGWLRYRDAGWALEDDRLVVRSRLLGRSTTIAPRRRLQSRATVRSPLQRRARLATFRARVASGGGGAELQITDLGSEAAEGLIERLRPRLQRSGQ